MIFSREEVFDNKIPNCILGIYYFIDGTTIFYTLEKVRI